jgi:hypothetical protein
LREDWGLIESSLAKQYGIRIRSVSDMSWNEFCNLISGLMPDTPLGQIVAIRSEKDPKILKEFTPDQRRIRNEWRIRQANNKLSDQAGLAKDLEALEETIKRLFS